MKVTGLEELSKSRSKVFIEQEFAFVLYKGELRSYHIHEGEELAQADYDEIMNTILPRRAKLRAMNLLKSREYTEKQLHDKLKDGLYPEDIIQQALEYVAGYHYTDDLRYAETYISDHEETRSRRRIEQDLLEKGIDRVTLEKAWQQWEQKGGVQDEERMVRQLLDKRHYDPETADLKERQKNYGFLMRKGFSPDVIRRVIGW
ncbi:MAG: recombination regulator RecX [Eubacterium sp.]|nr:recombination regulator RecX [Eubacterium sp.]MCM1213195.1 recombination regulator RecX [Lachnospiraceae bacterium]MCM1303729.1 recombination regulator RecX [Butyrivibrio sp.]MCM1344362.1 recombination regulator RecX [Muribaculaceae bacterium]MCM1240328.1 recombination regulator RecX [Lachnospiraceae bacterium]